MPQSDWIKGAQLIPEYASYKVDGSGRVIIPAHLRNKFGMVLQDTWLFSGTVEENLRYGNLSASLENIKNISN